MATYTIDGIDYEIADGLDLAKTVEQIRALPEHRQAGKSFAFNPDPQAIGADRSLTQLAEDARSDIKGPATAAIQGGAGAAELIGAGISGLAGTIAGGLESAARLPFQGADKAVEEGQKTAHAMTYQPRTTMGQLVTNLAGEGLEHAKRGFGHWAALDVFNQSTDPQILEGQAQRRSIGEGAFDYLLNALPLHATKAGITQAREAKALKADLERIKAEKEQRAYDEANSITEADVALWDNSTPYIPTAERPFSYNVEPTKGASEFGIGKNSPEAARPDQRSLQQKYDDNYRQQTGLDPTTEQFPFNTAAHENSVNFPLRQEVLNSPEVTKMTDTWREEYARLQKEGASPEELAQFEKGFAEEMARYGVQSAADAHGLRRKLYEPEARALPVEKTKSLNDFETKPTDWSKHEPSAFELADFPEPKGKMRLQQGYVDPRMLTDGFKFMRDSLTKAGEKLKILGITNRAADNLDHLPTAIKDFIDHNTSHSSNMTKVNPRILRVIAMDEHGNPRGMAEFRPQGKGEKYLESDWTYVTEGHQGQGIARAMYDAVRAEGSDIRASAARTPQGRAMWNEFEKGSTIEQDHRPVLPRLDVGKYRPRGPKYVYTGSKARFNKFDSAYIGTGEGRASRGWGFYLAEEPQVANAYWKTLSKEKSGAVYKVELKASNFLDWEKTFQEQTPQVQEALRKAMPSWEFDTFVKNKTGEQLYKELAFAKESDKNASLLLDSLGVHGVKYLDQQSAVKKTSNTSNYVVFNEANLVNHGPHIIRGPKSQEGAVKPFGRSYENFRQEIKSKFGKEFSDDVIKGLWDEKTNKQPQVETSYAGNAKEAISNIPGMKQVIDDLVPNLKPVEELLPVLQQAKDIPGDLLAKGARQLMSGSKVAARFYNHPLIKTYADHVSVMQDTIRKNVDRLLFDKEKGVVDTFDNLKSTEQPSLWKVIRDNEGKRDLTRADLLEAGMNERQIKVYENLRAATKFVLDEINAARATTKQKPITMRPGYFPAKFIGDWYVTVHAADPTVNGRQRLIGLYSANNKWSINRVVDRIKQDHPDWHVSDVVERRPYSKKKGSEHAFNVYGDLMRVLEENDPRAQVLQDIIKEYEGEQANYTAGLFQHLKQKTGIEGSTGKSEYRTDIQNAHDAFKAFTDYVTQAMEYVETKKLQPSVSKLLDREKLPNLKNAQEYVSQHWDRTRGINNKFAQAIDDLVFSVAHTFGISGGAIKTGLGVGKSQLMFMLLGYWNPRFLIAQMLQPSQFLSQNISSLQARGLKGGVGDMAEAWAKGMYHMYKGGVGRDTMEPHARKALEWAEANRIVEPRMFEDIKTELEKQRDNLFGWVNGQKAIRWTEEKARTQTYLTFYELLNKAGIKGEEGYRMAADMTRHTMVDYRPYEKPLLYQNLGIIGDMISPLTTFKHNYYSQMAVAVKELARSGMDPKYAAPVVIMLAMQTLLSGLMGVPGKEDADMVLGWAKKFYPNMPDMTQVILQSGLPNYITHGVSAITGMDMSPTFAPASLIPDRANEIAPLPSKALDILGAAGNAVMSGTKSSKYALLQQVTPNSLQGVLENAMSEGDVVANPKNKMKGSVRRDTQDWVARGLGMRSIDESKEKTMMYKEGIDKQNITKKKEQIVEQAADALKDGKDIQKYMEEGLKYGMTPRQLIESIKELYKERALPESERFAGTPPKSYNQYLKYKRLQEYK